MGGRSICVCDEVVEFIKISLRQITSAHPASILDDNRDYAALLVLRDLCASRKVFGCIYAIGCVVNTLQVGSVDEMTTYGSTLQQVNQQGGGGVPPQQSTRETTQCPESPGASC